MVDFQAANEGLSALPAFPTMAQVAHINGVKHGGKPFGAIYSLSELMVQFLVARPAGDVGIFSG